MENAKTTAPRVAPRGPTYPLPATVKARANRAYAAAELRALATELAAASFVAANPLAPSAARRNASLTLLYGVPELAAWARTLDLAANGA